MYLVGGCSVLPFFLARRMGLVETVNVFLSIYIPVTYITLIAYHDCVTRLHFGGYPDAPE